LSVSQTKNDLNAKMTSNGIINNNNNNNNKQIFANNQTTELKNIASKNSINKIERKMQESFEEAPLWAAIITYIGYLILNIYGWLRDFLRFTGIEKKKTAMDNNPSVIQPLFFYFCFEKNLTY
jgi:hypothetical protein